MEPAEGSGGPAGVQDVPRGRALGGGGRLLPAEAGLAAWLWETDTARQEAPRSSNIRQKRDRAEQDRQAGGGGRGGVLGHDASGPARSESRAARGGHGGGPPSSTVPVGWGHRGCGSLSSLGPSTGRSEQKRGAAAAPKATRAVAGPGGPELAFLRFFRTASHRHILIFSSADLPRGSTSQTRCRPQGLGCNI
ncbi:unnamed protein product [Rangifer tarandus platyrhynchus]|uniref:Uncharacterized protein n=2 Tax=Rangifer tarandus platyrhynchus TaxID=3082113 RepID=A0ACB0F2L8_RANTA|nr:unnamed protein product [Rangifer tarandus platyrhynchus]CAI9707098.1 unnamed protein product [Rangifer tarandus platyrhynchus]